MRTSNLQQLSFDLKIIGYSLIPCRYGHLHPISQVPLAFTTAVMPSLPPSSIIASFSAARQVFNPPPQNNLEGLLLCVRPTIFLLQTYAWLCCECFLALLVPAAFRR